jgi:hypothetical protein
MRAEIKSPRVIGAGQYRSGETSDALNITQSRPHLSNRFSELSDLQPIHTEIRDALEQQIFGAMSDESFDEAASKTNEHLKSEGLAPIWRKADLERLHRIALKRFIEAQFDQAAN